MFYTSVKSHLSLPCVQEIILLRKGETHQNIRNTDFLYYYPPCIHIPRFQNRQHGKVCQTENDFKGKSRFCCYTLSTTRPYSSIVETPH